MNLFLDLETTFQTDEKGRTDPSPYIKENYLVSAGYSEEYKDPLYKFFKHNDLQNTTLESEKTVLQYHLSKTTLLIAHNAKFELAWLRACGFHYSGKIACTQIREYVLARGQKLPVNLKESCIRNNVYQKKSELVEDYLKQGIGFEAMPWETVQTYGIADVKALRALYYNQLERLNAAPYLWPTVHLMEEFCRCLVEIEENGIKIDVAELDRLEIEYKQQLETLTSELQAIVEQVMGATPVSLSSPEQLSNLIYSRRVIDKHKWKELFSICWLFRRI